MSKRQRALVPVIVGLMVFCFSLPASAATTYTVRPGDTLWAISRSFGVSLYDLRVANNVWTDLIYPGQRLVIPTSSRASGVTWAEIDLLARLVTAEATGEPFVGQVAVAAVVLNRVRSPLFPNSIAAVIYQPGQFCPVANGLINRPASETALRAVRAALAGWDPTGGALFFFNPAKTSSPFMWSRTVVAVYGNHWFCI